MSNCEAERQVGPLGRSMSCQRGTKFEISELEVCTENFFSILLASYSKRHLMFCVILVNKL